MEAVLRVVPDPPRQARPRAEGRRLVGIYTERDLMRNTIDPEFDPAGEFIGLLSIGDVIRSACRSAPASWRRCSRWSTGSTTRSGSRAAERGPP